MGWASIVSALSLAVIAVVLLVCAVAWLRWLRELEALAGGVDRLVRSLDEDARPALRSARRVADQANEIVSRVRGEFDAYMEQSTDVRERIGTLSDAVEERLRDLETLVDVVQFEVEETALDVAAALRTTRRSGSIVRAMKRAFVGRGR